MSILFVNYFFYGNKRLYISIIIKYIAFLNPNEKDQEIMKKQIQLLIVIALIFIVFLLGSRLFTNRTLAPYGYPIQAAGLLITALFGLETGLVIAIPLSLLASYAL